MWKLGRYNLYIEYKTWISNVSADILSRRPDHIGTKSTFIYFADQRGQPLVLVEQFDFGTPVTQKFYHRVRPIHSTIRITILSTDSTNIIVPVA